LASAGYLADKATMEIVLAAHAPRPKAPSPGGGPASWQAAWISATLHAAGLAALCTLFLPSRLPEAPAQPAFTFVMAQPSDPAIEQSFPETQLKSVPIPVVLSLTAPRPLSLAPPRRQPSAARKRPNQPTQANAAPGPAQVRPHPAEASPAPPEQMLSGLEARIRQAVQEAAIYPASARIMHLQGRTQVRFDYTDGTAATLDVATSSTSPILDRAALAAVRNAALPRAPAPIGARTLPVLVWVNFHLVQQD
jgi:protein TonB